MLMSAPARLRRSTRPDTPERALTRRLRPLRVAAFLQSVGFWVPVEKLFETEIGLDAAAIGLVAAAYAAVVPLVEVPSGVLADRWSRRGVLMVASLALSVSAVLGGLSHDVTGYLLSAVVLGVFFAMYSGTVDAVVYDVVLAGTGRSDRFERELGRVRLVDSLGLVTSALAGGWLAEALSTRATYWLTVPFGLAAALVYLRFAEPGLHREERPTRLREHVGAAYRALLGGRRALAVVALAVLTALLAQVVLEFGPLWLVALAVPAALYGPYWAGLTGMLGFGGLLAGWFPLRRRPVALVVAGLLAGAGAVLTLPVPAAAATAAHVVLVALTVMAGIHVTRLLHDTVPSAVRAGVASAVSTLSWLVFVPFALAVGLLGSAHGVAAAGWLMAGTAVVAGTVLVGLADGRRAKS